MKTVFDAPFLTRVYPSPRTGAGVVVHVKEVLLTEYPREYVKRRFDAAADIGNHLICTEIRGMRVWKVEEIREAGESEAATKQHPWMEIWEIGTTDQIAVLDVIMYTEFYSEKTMDRFEKFLALVMPLIKDHGALIMAASGSGVSVQVGQIDNAELRSVAEAVLDFNAVHFGVEAPRAGTVKRFLKSKTLWFGYC